MGWIGILCGGQEEQRCGRRKALGMFEEGDPSGVLSLRVLEAG